MFWSKRLSVAIQVLSWSTKSWIFSFVELGFVIDSILDTFGIAIVDDEIWCDTWGAIVDEKWGTIEAVVVDRWDEFSANDPKSICEPYY